MWCLCILTCKYNKEVEMFLKNLRSMAFLWFTLSIQKSIKTQQFSLQSYQSIESFHRDMKRLNKSLVFLSIVVLLGKEHGIKIQKQMSYNNHVFRILQKISTALFIMNFNGAHGAEECDPEECDDECKDYGSKKGGICLDENTCGCYANVK